MYPDLAGGAAGIQRSLHEMLFKSSTHFVLIPEEKDLPLRPVSIIETGCTGSRSPLPYHMVQNPVVGQTPEPVGSVEGKTPDIVHKFSGLGILRQLLAGRKGNRVPRKGP